MLALDEKSLDIGELSMNTLTREIGLADRPNWLLSKMMNLLESKRQSMGLGWSRPWNKVGLTVFRTHVNEVTDEDYYRALWQVLVAMRQDIPPEYWAFVEEIFRDPKQMGFTFYHNRADGDAQYEGLTISIGRVVQDDKRRRDRLDLILEDRRDADGAVDGIVDRVRLYICPWSSYHTRDYHLTDTACADSKAASCLIALHKLAVSRYHGWKMLEDRQWKHWSAQYIDYFGHRSFIPVGSSFT